MNHTMYENLALQGKAAGGDPVSIEVLCTMRSESKRKIEAEAIAHSQLPRIPDSFDMQEDVLVDMEDPQVDDSEP
jgi:hypothetical protein